LVGLSFEKGIAVRFETVKKVLLIILFLNISLSAFALSDGSETTKPAANRESVEASFLPDMQMTFTLEDKIWMQQQLENLKMMKLLDSNEIIPSENTTCINNHSYQPPQSLPLESHSRLLIFISFSMPKESLKALSLQAKKTGGILVLRGLVDNSLKKTLAKIVEIWGHDNLSILTIDPIAFRDFDIQAAPAVVVAASPQQFDVIQGDVSLVYILRKIVDEGESVLLAQSYLNGLQGAP
jgi:type-F conjugative transfer system pilin assembly protein TrbC